MVLMSTRQHDRASTVWLSIMGWLMLTTVLGLTPSASAESPRVLIGLHARAKVQESQIIVTNEDSFDWTNVRFRIIAQSQGSFSTPTIPRVVAGQMYPVSIGEFAGDDGTRLDPQQLSVEEGVLMLSIGCDTPRGDGTWSGSRQSDPGSAETFGFRAQP